MMNGCNTPLHQKTRRHFFADCGVGIGKIALSALLADGLSMRVLREHRGAKPNDSQSTSFRAAGKGRYLPVYGRRTSQLDLFDNKPMLGKYEGQTVPADLVKDQRYAFIRPDSAPLGPRFKFAQHGQSGSELSEMLPHLAEVADDIAIVRSMHTDQFNHVPCANFAWLIPAAHCPGGQVWDRG